MQSQSYELSIAQNEGKPISQSPHCPKSCDPEEAMKILFGILVVLTVAASFFADYKWRQWIANHRRDRQ
jgi:hypothetical protein